MTRTTSRSTSIRALAWSERWASSLEPESTSLTDGKRVLVVTHSRKDEMKESYAFTVDAHGNVAFEDVRLR